MKFLPLPATQIKEKWDKIAPILNKAVCLSPTKIDIDDVLSASLAGSYLVWVVTDQEKIIAVVTTRLVPYPKGNAMALDFVAGDRMKECTNLVLTTIEDHAKHNKCIHLEGFGRKAWGRYLKKLGWYESHITYHKAI